VHGKDVKKLGSIRYVVNSRGKHNEEDKKEQNFPGRNE
jgi:hypothetical protein